MGLIRSTISLVDVPDSQEKGCDPFQANETVTFPMRKSETFQRPSELEFIHFLPRSFVSRYGFLRFEKRNGYGPLKLFEILVRGKDGMLSFDRHSAYQEIGG
jgi:hypothetical protein